ncbi:hypothetical protein BH23CHL5_BH23CHL5_25830 [soil metagenome]
MVTLEVFVHPDCLAGDTAQSIVDRLRRLRFPNVDIRLIDLSLPGVIRPAAIFTVPTYVLNDKVISLGNPAFDELLKRITDLLQGSDLKEIVR